MDVRITDLDGGLTDFSTLLKDRRILPLREWGPKIRISCSHGRFRQFRQELTNLLGSDSDAQPQLSFIGSGDFHHVTLAMLHRLRNPFNLLVLDNHPDWMRAVPVMHCGTWLYHAAQLPNCQRIFHLGGDVDFDSLYRLMAPWPEILRGKITILPAHRQFQGKHWKRVPHESLRPAPGQCLTVERMEMLLESYSDDLSRWPLYISLDKDVMTASEAVVNWDSGHLTFPEVLIALRCAMNAAEGRLAGMDVVGDWSRVRMQGLFRRFLALWEHPRLRIDPEAAARSNENLNQTILETLNSLNMLSESRRSYRCTEAQLLQR